MFRTDSGATGSRKFSSALYAPIRSRNAIRKIIAGKKASSELYATCCESPMQSSDRNSLPLCLKTASQSRALRRSASVAVDKGEPPEAGLRRPLAPPPDHPHRRPDPARGHNPGSERACGDDGQLRAQLLADVRRLPDLVPEVVDGSRELLALGLDLVPHLGRSAVVRASRHRP